MVRNQEWDVPGGPGTKASQPQCRWPGFNPTLSKLRVCTPQVKIPRAAAKTERSHTPQLRARAAEYTNI